MFIIFTDRTLRNKDLAFGIQMHIFTYQKFGVKSRKSLHLIVEKARRLYGYTHYRITMPVLVSFRPEAAISDRGFVTVAARIYFKAVSRSKEAQKMMSSGAQ